MRLPVAEMYPERDSVALGSRLLFNLALELDIDVKIVPFSEKTAYRQILNKHLVWRYYDYIINLVNRLGLRITLTNTNASRSVIVSLLE